MFGLVNASLYAALLPLWEGFDEVPVGGYMYVPMYDPYVVFASPRPGFFVGGAIRFGGGFRWIDGYNRFDWRRHEVFVNRRVWTPPVRTYEPPRPAFEQRRFEDNPNSNRDLNRNYTLGALMDVPPAFRARS
jgi:hypothetical protein